MKAWKKTVINWYVMAKMLQILLYNNQYPLHLSGQNTFILNPQSLMQTFIYKCVYIYIHIFFGHYFCVFGVRDLHACCM